jgi:hypothetical protein
VLEKNTLKKDTNLRKHLSMPLYLGFQAGSWQEIILWDPIVVLPKPTLMNHGH